MVRARGALVLAVLSVAQFLIALDYSIVYVALPSIAGDLRLSPSHAQWVISAYAVLFAGFLVLGGRLTDRIGAGRAFAVSMVGFGVASAVGAVAVDGTVLLAARAGQGLGAAMLQPAVLALIGTSFPAGRPRARAVAVWGAVGASGLAAGVILGGLLTTVSWRLTFAVNVPLTLLCAMVAVVWLGAVKTGTPQPRIPVLASALGTAAALSLVLWLTLGPDQGWASWPALGCAVLTVVLLGGFIGNERGTRNPLVDPVLRATRSLRTGAAATALYMASVGSEFYLLTLLFQEGRGYSPLEAGLGFLPLAVMVTVGNGVVGRLIPRYGAGMTLAAGFAVATTGLVWLAVALHGDSYLVDLVGGILLSGLGHGAIYTSMFVIGTRDVGAAHQGTAGALLTTSQYLAGAVTVAVLVFVLGPAPGDAGFRNGFLLTAVAAAAGVIVALRHRRRP